MDLLVHEVDARLDESEEEPELEESECPRSLQELDPESWRAGELPH